MHPEIFTIFQHVFLAYSFFMFLAVIIVLAGSFWLGRKRNLPRKPVMILLLIMLVGVFIGARSLNISINLALYLNDPQLAYSIGSRGFSLYGGAVGAVIFALIFGPRLKIDLWKLGDTIAPFLGIGIAFLRIGCFLNGCCFGKVTWLPWGVRFPVLSSAHLYQISHGQGSYFSSSPVHPTQLYELVGALVASGISVFLLRRKIPTGVALLSFVIFFTIVRWANYYIRVMPESFNASIYFYPLLYLGIIILCVALLFMRLKKSGSSEKFI